MTDRIHIARRVERALDALARTGLPTTTADQAEQAVTQQLGDLRHLIDNEIVFETLLDASATDAFRDRLHRGTHYAVNPHTPRARVWRQLLLEEGVCGRYRRVWPPELNDAVIEACVETEAAAIAHLLADEAAQSGLDAAWDPDTGHFTVTGDARAFLPKYQFIMIANAASTVLDSFDGLEANALGHFVADKAASLEALGYDLVITAVTWEEDPEPVVEPDARKVTLPSPDWVSIRHAQAVANLATLADTLPPCRIDPGAHHWHHGDFVEQVQQVTRTSALDPAVLLEFMAALAEERMRAVNDVLSGSGHVWDPRLHIAVPVPTKHAPPLTAAQLAAVEAAKQSVDPARVWARTIGPLPIAPQIGAAFPPQAEATRADTGPAEATEPAPIHPEVQP